MQVKSKMEISDNFSKELESENKNLKDYLMKIIQDKQLILMNLERKSLDDISKKSNEMKYLQINF